MHALDQYRTVITFTTNLLASQQEKSAAVKVTQTVSGKHLSSWSTWIHQNQQSIRRRRWKRCFSWSRINFCHCEHSVVSTAVHLQCMIIRLTSCRKGGGLIYFVYSNKQCQCSGLWQTLNWIAIVINKLVFRHLFLKEAGETNTECSGDFISIAEVWRSALWDQPLYQSFLYEYTSNQG